jgi:hypothetical protein
MAEQIPLAAPDAGDAVDPGQQPGILERLDRLAHRVAVALGGSGNPRERREAPAAAIGTVEAPQDRFEDVQGGAGQRP